jgi:hypothetical protein
MESIDNKRDLYAIAFNHGFQLGGVMKRDIVSKLILRRIVKQKANLYSKGLLDGLTEKIKSLEKERKSRSFLDEIESVRKTIDRNRNREKEI